ncbi:hypothetical protein [Leptospira ilyithenensis]|uniref:Uncharacterized protein n=1 Tax=Leptospira ilyithenensis TaxID=2484901 RepID=A0A4R9LJH2_9LEPT|nr:hypothetical protein [Leptospira ilyithenensis]TGN07026.1 hypothetical protein EHS11_18040 [Leptospira ilyithenensis]
MNRFPGFLLLLTSFSFCNLQLNNTGDPFTFSNLLTKYLLEAKPQCEAREWEFNHLESRIGGKPFLYTVENSVGEVYTIFQTYDTFENRLNEVSGTNALNVMLIKFNSSGKILWSRSLGIADEGFNHLKLTDNGVIATANVLNSVGTPIHPYSGITSTNIGVFSVTSNGDLIWNTYINDEGTDNFKTAALETRSNGEVLVLGYSSAASKPKGFGEDRFSGRAANSDLILVNLSPNGTGNWFLSVGNSTQTTEGMSLKKIDDDNILILGKSKAALDPGFFPSPVFPYTGASVNFQYVVLHYNVNTRNLKHTFIGTNSNIINVVPPSIQYDHSKNLIYLGLALAGSIGGEIRAPSASNDPLLVQLDSNLNRKWISYFGTTDLDLFPGNIDIYPNGSVYTSVSYGSANPNLGNQYPGSFSHGGILEYNSEGQILRYVLIPTYDLRYVYPLQTIHSCDGGYILSSISFDVSIAANPTNPSATKIKKTRSTDFPRPRPYVFPTGGTIYQ